MESPPLRLRMDFCYYRGCMLTLTARNSDLWSFVESMKQMEDRFNHWAGYDYVFLNDEVSEHQSSTY